MPKKVKRKRKPRQPRARAAPIPNWSSSDRAAKHILNRHGVDPQSDPLVGLAAGAAETAAYLATFQDVVSWWRKLKAQYEMRPPMPAHPKAAMGRPLRLGNEFKKHLEKTSRDFFAAADALHEAGNFLEEQERYLDEGIVLHSRADSKGGRPKDVADLAFAFTLDYLWKRSRRQKLTSTDLACLSRLTLVRAPVRDLGKKWSEVLKKARDLPFDPQDHESVTPATVEVYLMLRNPPGPLLGEETPICARVLVEFLLRRKTKE
jgi:hypothetical protein